MYGLSIKTVLLWGFFWHVFITISLVELSSNTLCNSRTICSTHRTYRSSPSSNVLCAIWKSNCMQQTRLKIPCTGHRFRCFLTCFHNDRFWWNVELGWISIVRQCALHIRHKRSLVNELEETIESRFMLHRFLTPGAYQCSSFFHFG